MFLDFKRRESVFRTFKIFLVLMGSMEVPLAENKMNFFFFKIQDIDLSLRIKSVL